MFKRNPDFYGVKPHLDGFGLQFFQSPDAMVTALKAGQLDAIEHLPPTAVASVKAAGFHVAVGPSLEFRDFIFNSNPKKPQRRELLNPKVRMAFEYAINRQQIVKTAWLGYATPGSTIVVPAEITNGIHWHNSAIKPLPFDIAKANQILDSLGYARGAKRDPDGRRSPDVLHGHLPARRGRPGQPRLPDHPVGLEADRGAAPPAATGRHGGVQRDHRAGLSST